jgi:hypothetical protein
MEGSGTTSRSGSVHVTKRIWMQIREAQIHTDPTDQDGTRICEAQKHADPADPDAVRIPIPVPNTGYDSSEYGRPKSDNFVLSWICKLPEIKTFANCAAS